MTSDISLPELRKRVARAREDQAKRLERKKLGKELFQLKNPGVLSFKKGLVSGAKAFGRGAVVTARGVQKFAVRQQAVARLREQGRRMAIPAIKQATRTKQKAIRSAVKPKKRRKVSRSNDFGFGGPLDDFGF